MLKQYFDGVISRPHRKQSGYLVALIKTHFRKIDQNIRLTMFVFSSHIA